MYTQAPATLFSLKERWQYLTERLRKRMEAVRAEGSPAGTDPVSVVKFKFEQVTMAAVRRYTPSRFSGRVCHFLANRDWLRPDDARQGWQSMAVLRWRSVALHYEEYYGPDSCNPDLMLVDPDARAFAELFRQCREGNAMKVAFYSSAEMIA